MAKVVQKRSEFAKEAEATSTAVAACGPSAAMLALFSKKTETESALDTMKRMNMPQLIKAVDRNGENIPIGGVVAGIIVDVIASPKTDIKGSLLWLHLVNFEGPKNTPVKTGVEITFPATGVIRQALAPNAEGERGAEKEGNARIIMLKYKGHLFVAKRQENRPTKEDAAKEMTTWDVRLSEKPVDIGVKIH